MLKEMIVCSEAEKEGEDGTRRDGTSYFASNAQICRIKSACFLFLPETRW